MGCHPGCNTSPRRCRSGLCDLLDRHVNGNWGELDEHDFLANETAIGTGSRILSLYQLSTGIEIYVITDAIGDDGFREATTIMLRVKY